MHMSQLEELQLELAIGHKTLIHQKSSFMHASAPGVLAIFVFN